MTCGEKLAAALRPLGVYDLRPESFSGAELAALGAVMDETASRLSAILREANPLTAEDYGLTLPEALFPCRAPGGSAEARRQALVGFWQVTEDGFTLAALQRCLSACGLDCVLRETGTPGAVEISFPGVMGEPADFARVQAVLETILPCHLDIRYVFAWCTWAVTEQAGLTWEDLETGSWEDWEEFCPDAA